MLYTRDQLFAQIQQDREFYSSQSEAVQQAWATQISYFSNQFSSDDSEDNTQNSSQDAEMLQC